MQVTPLSALSSSRRAALVDRDAGVDDIIGDVRAIVDTVCEDGDDALRRFSREFDGVDVEDFDVTADVDAAYESISDDVRGAIETAAGNIREFHAAQRPSDWRDQFGDRELGRRFRPIERVGVYAPGGTAAYPSSVLMGVIPAVVAGVNDVTLVTPPANPVNPVTLAAARVAGADRVFSVGGAQAVAALAYGTESVPRVEKIVGPGNRWVTAAKAVVRGDVEIDFLAGPSEIMVVADETANARFVAADMLAQAEHDPNASVVAVTTDEATAERIVTAIEEETADRARRGVIEKALAADASGVFLAESMDEAVAFAEEYAAEHLSIQTVDEDAVLDRIDSAGSVFLGPYTPVAAGDYASGTNHVLPTNGRARVTGGLSVDTFLRSTTVQRLDEPALSGLADTITTLADAEGLEAHAESVRTRLDGHRHR